MAFDSNASGFVYNPYENILRALAAQMQSGRGPLIPHAMNPGLLQNLHRFQGLHAQFGNPGPFTMQGDVVNNPGMGPWHATNIDTWGRGDMPVETGPPGGFGVGTMPVETGPPGGFGGRPTGLDAGGGGYGGIVPMPPTRINRGPTGRAEGGGGPGTPYGMPTHPIGLLPINPGPSHPLMPGPFNPGGPVHPAPFPSVNPGIRNLIQSILQRPTPPTYRPTGRI